MEVLTPDKSREEFFNEIDEKARRVFNQAIELLGGLKKLIEFRNLTWLPSLAEAAYSVVLKNEIMSTEREIAEKLGITKQSVDKILSAKEEKLESFLKGEIEKPNEHKAGSLAKLAYRKLKEEGLLEGTTEISNKQINEIEKILNVDIAWPILVLNRVKGVDFPVNDKNLLYEKLNGIFVKNKNIGEIIYSLDIPINSTSDLLHKIKENIKTN